MTTIFGNPGSTELPMLAEFPDDFRYVLGLQEAVAVGMADGYAQASGGPAHVNLHTAPGVGNGMGAIFNAQANHSPLVVTAGQQVRAHITMQANLTNRDATRVVHPFVKWSFEPPRAQDVPHALARAIHTASLAPQGPGVRLAADGRLERGGRPGVGARRRANLGAALRARTRTRSAALAKRLEEASNPVLVAGPDIDASGGWDDAVALAERQKLPVFASPAPGGGRLGFPEGHPLFQGVLPPAIGPVAETLKGRDLILVVGSSVFPYYPYIPGPLLPEGASLVAITSDPDEAARAPMGDVILADVGLALRALLAEVGEANRAEPAPLPEPSAGDETDPMTPTMVHNTLAEVFPEDGIVVLESPSSTLALRNQLRLSRAGQLLLRRGRRPRLRPGRRDRRPARPARPPGRLRPGRGLRPVRDHRLLDRRGLRRPGHLPGPPQRGVLDPQVVRRHRGGEGRARPRPAGAGGRRGGRAPTGSRRTRSPAARSCTRRSRGRSAQAARSWSRCRWRPAWRCSRRGPGVFQTRRRMRPAPREGATGVSKTFPPYLGKVFRTPSSAPASGARPVHCRGSSRRWRL